METKPTERLISKTVATETGPAFPVVTEAENFLRSSPLQLAYHLRRLPTSGTA